MSSKAVFFLLLVSAAEAQMVRKCLCSEVQPCRQAYIDGVAPCADKCKKFAVKAGVNFDRIKRCTTDFSQYLNETIRCIDNTYADSCATEFTDKRLPKRHSELLKASFVNEITKDLAKKNLLTQWNRLNAQLRKYQSCIKLCLDMRTSQCDEKLDCTLELPADKQLIEDTRNCVDKINIPRKWCECAVDSGLKDLKEICDVFRK
ncbi:unnamed protein product [Bursaphelenchus xylophilus]|uniref:(pine wood nematode) hypothetical protein n=1 Tax=Bursaphelenchus xylophilus TaxID=6326 RepID=A0A1I7SG19_BURXY|nr:unnamed protein product [Bursaphelenchus xylophilus]CAG9089298.1 unnamed protein product [Bursaphelenchus xylophilus]